MDEVFSNLTDEELHLKLAKIQRMRIHAYNYGKSTEQIDNIETMIYNILDSRSLENRLKETGIFESGIAIDTEIKDEGEQTVVKRRHRTPSVI